jgi:predicted NBD/HSP70 family sugar kinase
LSTATVSRIVDELLSARLLRVTGTNSERAVGRRSEVLRLNPRGGRIIGAHLGGHSNDVALADLSGEIYLEEHLPLIGSQDIDEVLHAVGDAIDRLMAQDTRTEPILGIGVATGGVVDMATGELIAHGQFPWRNVPLRDWFERRFGLYVSAGNAFQGLAWYESLFGDVERDSSLLFVNCSTIIGAGFSTPNNITGSTSISSGMLGHAGAENSDIPCTCGQRGCLQATASDLALVRLAECELEAVRDDPSIMKLGELAHAGDRTAIRLFEERARMLVPAIAVLANTLGPGTLALGHNRHPYADEEHAVFAEMIRASLFPPLRSRIQIRQVLEAEPTRTVATSIAILIRDFYSPSLELVKASRGRLVPILVPASYRTTSSEVPALALR